MCKECEQESIATSLKNLKSFPFIEEAIAKRDMQIHGIYFDLEQGQLWYYDDAIDAFNEIGYI